jgi:hypothetical protein
VVKQAIQIVVFFILKKGFMVFNATFNNIFIDGGNRNIHFGQIKSPGQKVNVNAAVFNVNAAVFNKI